MNKLLMLGVIAGIGFGIAKIMKKHKNQDISNNQTEQAMN